MINKTIDICDELAQNFLDFSYEANSQRAFPDARDGLKPGQRACLWEMYDKGYTSNKPHVKSAKISGGVIANWWPHGSTAIYETFARMSQEWINNIPEVSWHGMNGSQIISGEPAADRYTEARLAKIVEDGMFTGIKKKNVPMVPNFSEDDEWPEVLPAIFPRLLVNGSQGIGVTIANTWLPTPFSEAAAVLIKYLSTGEVDTSLIAPSFPSGGIIINKNDIPTIYNTGKGKVVVRGKTEIKGNSIFITEMPYQVYVEPYIEKLKELIKNEEIVGIDEILNKSGKKGLCIEIICDENPEQVLLSLFRKTDLQNNYNANQWALVGKTPKLLTLTDYCKIYVAHNIDCIKRETTFDLDKAKAKLHIIEGLLIALEDIDNIIQLIKKSESAVNAKKELINNYSLSEIQAQAILDMKLARLAKLEKIELEQEKKELIDKIAEFEEILINTSRQLEIIKTRLSSLLNKYGDKRKTELTQIEIIKEKKEKPKIIPEDCIVIISENNYIKRVSPKIFKPQKRNTMGDKTANGNITIFAQSTNTQDTLMVFSNKGKMYRVSINTIPEGTNISNGIPINHIIEFEDNEVPIAFTTLSRDTDKKFIFFATKKGIIKKVLLEEYDKMKRTGIIAINFKEGDELADVTFINQEEMMLITKKGMVIRFKTAEMASSSRIAQGIKGMNVNEDDYIIAALPIINSNAKLAIVGEDCLGKQISLSEFTIQNRGGKGVSCYKKPIAGAALVVNNDLLLISGDKSVLLIKSEELPVLGRAPAGNIILKNNDKIISITKV